MARFRSSSFKKNLYHFEEGKEVTITTLIMLKREILLKYRILAKEEKEEREKRFKIDKK